MYGQMEVHTESTRYLTKYFMAQSYCQPIFDILIMYLMYFKKMIISTFQTCSNLFVMTEKKIFFMFLCGVAVPHHDSHPDNNKGLEPHNIADNQPIYQIAS